MRNTAGIVLLAFVIRTHAETDNLTWSGAYLVQNFTRLVDTLASEIFDQSLRAWSFQSMVVGNWVHFAISPRTSLRSPLPLVRQLMASDALTPKWAGYSRASQRLAAPTQGRPSMVSRAQSLQVGKSSDHSWVRTLGFTKLQGKLEFAVSLALQCGHNMLTTAGAAALYKDGENGIDPQTAIDVENERFVTEGLRNAYPEDGIIGEETVAATGRLPTDDEIAVRSTWIIDPIDGTQNFCHGMPESVVSIGYAVGGLPELGVVYDPYRDELYVGTAAEGAYLNGRKLPRIDANTAPTSLDRAIVMSDLGYERSAQGSRRLAAVHKALIDSNVFALRIVGSTVLSLAWLAAGRVDAVYMGIGKRDTPKAWDWCAAWALGRAVGVTFQRLHDDTPFTLTSSSVCAARSSALADALRDTIHDAVVALPME